MEQALVVTNSLSEVCDNLARTLCVSKSAFLQQKQGVGETRYETVADRRQRKYR